jgi:transposase
MSTADPNDLTDAEWDCLQHYLPPLPRYGRLRTHPLRRVLDAIFCVLRTGCAWRYLPSNFPPWQTVFYHFRRFRLQSTWHLLYAALASFVPWLKKIWADAATRVRSWRSGAQRASSRAMAGIWRLWNANQLREASMCNHAGG